MAITVQPDTISDAEQTVLSRLADGEVADFSGAPVRPTVRAELLHQLAAGAPPRGIRLRGVHVAGRLDLTDAALQALVLEECDLPDVVDVSHAQLGHLSIVGSRFRHLAARSSTIDGAFDFAMARPFADEAWIDAARASVGAGIDGCDAQLKSPPVRPREEVRPWNHQYALGLANLELRGSVLLNGSFVADGGLCLDDAHIRGSLWARGATIIAGEGDDFHPGDAVHAHTAKIDGFVGFAFGFRAVGRVWLLGAKIGDRLTVGFTDSHLKRVGESWDWGNRLLNSTVLLVIDQAEIGGNFHFSDITADGAVNMNNVKIGADATFTNSTIRNATPDGKAPAITARSAEIVGNLSLGRGLNAEGQVILEGIRVGGTLDCSGANLSNPAKDGPGLALDARWARIGHEVLPEGLSSGGAPGAGATIQGAVRFDHARIGQD